MSNRQPCLDFNRRVPLGSQTEVERLFAELERPLDTHLVANGLAFFAGRIPSAGQQRR